MDEENLLVEITRSHGSLKVAEISVSELYDLDWRTESGGYHKRSGGYSLYAKIPYSMMKELVDCSGKHDNGKNDGLVLILKQYPGSNYYKGYKYLLENADPKPQSDISKQRPVGQPPCTKKILSLLNDGPKTHGCVRSALLDIGYQETTIRGAIYRLKVQEKIICEGPPQSKNQLISLS